MAVKEILFLFVVFAVGGVLATPGGNGFACAPAAAPHLAPPLPEACASRKKRETRIFGVNDDTQKYYRRKRQVDSKALESNMNVGGGRVLSTCRNQIVQNILRKRISSDVETSMFRIRDNLNAECLSNYLVVCSTKGKAFSYKSRLASLCSNSNGMVACFVFEM